jgi:subtilisin family serine protease
VRAVAPVIPTRLIHPVPADEAGAGGEPAAAPGPTWGVRAVGADVTARTGAGVAVSVLDTGIDDQHPAFAGVELVQEDFSGAGNGDRQGHGTHCAGTIFGRDVDGTRIGVAPGIDRAFIGKVLGDDGSGDSNMIFRGIQWAVQQGASVISMSIGFDFPGLVDQLVTQGWPADLATSAALEGYRANLRMFDALMGVVRAQAAFSPGSILVAAAGNESKRTVDPNYEIGVSIPAAAEGIVSVGALAESTGSGMTIAPFSNTFPQISAPGVNVYSARAGSTGLVSFNGTSMATPHVAGVLALWWEDVLASRLPATATTVLARAIAHADVTGISSGVDVEDRGVGIVRAP